MRTQLDIQRDLEAQAWVIFFVSMTLIGLGIWRAIEGEWIPASVLIGFAGLKFV